MPPWMPGQDSPPYLGQSRRILTTAEKQLIARWVRGGAPIGAGGTVKPVGGTSSAPGTTMTLTPARSYMPKAAVGGLDDYHCFLLEPHLTRDEYVTSAVIKPQRSTIVHHVILFEAAGENAAEARHLNDASGGNGWTCFGGPGLAETHPTTNTADVDRLGVPPWIAAWVPGHANNDLPQGTGVLVHAGAAIVMQVHYNLIHKPQRDRSPHVASAMRPPGLTARRISRTACSGSGACISPSAHKAASKLAFGTSSRSASMRSKRTLVRSRCRARARAAMIMRSDRSTPSTWPRAPTAPAASSETRPVPQATSSTRSPGANAANSSSRACAAASCSRHSGS